MDDHIITIEYYSTNQDSLTLGWWSIILHVPGILLILFFYVIVDLLCPALLFLYLMKTSLIIGGYLGFTSQVTVESLQLINIY